MASGPLVTLILLVPCVLTDVTYTQDNCSYSWKSYDGNIPEDAIPGGYDQNGEIFYVGLVHLKLINEIFAGMIVPASKTAKITSLGITRDVRNDPFTVLHILCSPDFEAFKWVNTTSEDLSRLSENLVEGGKVLGQDLYIGRVGCQRGVVLGKVFPHGFIYQGLYAPMDGFFGHFLEYEVLTFDCKFKEVVGLDLSSNSTGKLS